MSLGLDELGRRIRQARDEAELTQQDLADRIGIKTGQSISRYERGETEVSTKRLRRIAEATRKDLAFFITLPDDVPQAARLEAQIARLIVLLEAEQAHRSAQQLGDAEASSERRG